MRGGVPGAGRLGMRRPRARGDVDRGQPVERASHECGCRALARLGLERRTISARSAMILAIDIGGTKFSMAVFAGDRMVRRESRATDAGGGREWMGARIAAIAGEWRREFKLERCGIGFGGPVNFAEQRVVLSTHVSGWRGFCLLYTSDAADDLL